MGGGGLGGVERERVGPSTGLEGGHHPVVGDSDCVVERWGRHALEESGEEGRH